MIQNALNYFQTTLRSCVLVLGLFLLVGLSPQIVQADTNFRFDLHSTYTVAASKTTRVQHALTITNKTPTLYVQKYALKITSGTAITNVSVKSNGETLTPNVVSTDNQTSIGLSFSDKVVGEGKTRELLIAYDQQDASIISGQVLELYVPPLNTDQSYDSYRVTIVTPASYGPPVRVNPAPISSTSNGSHIITEFDQVGEKGIATLFGSEQLFNMTLRYNLENTTNGPGLLQIALPPDTPYQRMHYSQIEPLPEKMETDPDGNWIATYQLPASSQTIVYATVQAKLSLEPNPMVPTTTPDSDWIRPQTYWESDQASITSLTDKHQTPQQIYNFVTNQLTYSYSPEQGTPERYGAVASLANPTTATCQEFTDLFVALARANQIPARRLTGYAHTENSSLRPLSLVEDILHAWPEFYDSETKSWHQVDPTWGNTTGGVNYFDQFDLNHIVFAINGQSSQTPYPAGSYKLTAQNTKDVSIEFGTTFTEATPTFAIDAVPKRIWGIAIPGWSELVITNQAGQAWYDLNVQIAPPTSQVKLSQTSKTIDTILPFQTVRLPIEAFDQHQLWPTKTSLQVTMLADSFEETVTDTVYVQLGPIYASYFTSPAFLVGLAIGSAGVALTAGGILVSRRR